jgi:hypothetical protein
MGGAEARAPWCFFVVSTSRQLYSEDLGYLKSPPFPGRSPTLVLLCRGSGLLLGACFAVHEGRAGEMHRMLGKVVYPEGAPPRPFHLRYQTWKHAGLK